MKLVSASFNNLLRREIDVSLKELDILEYQHSFLHLENIMKLRIGKII